MIRVPYLPHTDNAYHGRQLMSYPNFDGMRPAYLWIDERGNQWEWIESEYDENMKPWSIIIAKRGQVARIFAKYKKDFKKRMVSNPVYTRDEFRFYRTPERYR